MNRFALAALLCSSLLVPVLSASDWSGFRGPDASGIYSETKLPLEFGPQKNVAWKTPLPQGNSSPAFAADSIFVTGFEGDKLLTISLDRKTGRIKWRREIARTRTGELREPNKPAAASPATDGQNVYAFFQDFGLVSYGPDGNERWRIPLGPFNNPMGMASSPLLANGKIIQVCDSETDSFMIAADKDTAKIVWRDERPAFARGFSTPVLWDPTDGTGLQAIVPGSFELVAYNVDTGKRVWWVRSLTWQLKPTPIIEGDTIYVLGWAGGADFGQQEQVPEFDAVLKGNDKNGDGKLSPEEAAGAIDEKTLKGWVDLDLDRDNFLGQRDWEIYQAKRSMVNSMQAIKLGGKGDMTKTAVKWQYYKSLPNVPSPLLYGDAVYMIKDGGILTALDKRTGEVLKQGRLRDAMDRYFSSPVAADGRIYMASEPGVISVLKPGADWEVLQANKLDDEIHSTPVFMDGRMFVRTQSALYAFGGK